MDGEKGDGRQKSIRGRPSRAAELSKTRERAGSQGSIEKRGGKNS